MKIEEGVIITQVGREAGRQRYKIKLKIEEEGVIINYRGGEAGRQRYIIILQRRE